MNLLHTLRSLLINTFLSLPLLLIAFIGLLGIGLGNIGFFILFLGHALVLPVAIPLLHLLSRLIGGVGNPSFYVRSSDVGQLVPSAIQDYSYQNVVPSYWLTHIWFFMGYLFTNALNIYKLPKADKANPRLYANRRTRSIALMISTTVFVLILTMLRYRTGAETMLGVVASAAVGGGLGFGWYEFAKLCGARHADMFGIAQQILPEEAKKAAGPMACMAAGKK